MSRLKYLNNNWIDSHETWCRHLASPYGPNFNLSNIFFINHKPKKNKIMNIPISLSCTFSFGAN